jgi:hypothetical protein
MEDKYKKRLEEEQIQASNDRDKYKKRLEEEQIQTSIYRAKSKKRKEIKKFKAEKLFDEYSKPRNTGHINWSPKHSAVTERWVGKFEGKNIFAIEKRLFKYSLKIIDKRMTESESKNKRIREGSGFDLLALVAEGIIGERLKLKKEEKDNEVHL